MKKSVVLPYERYQQLMQNSTQHIQQNIEPDIPVEHLTVTAQTEPNTSEELETTQLKPDVIIACLPKRNQLKARRLLQYIHDIPKLTWNREGNLVVDKQPIAYSHIVDLLHDALNPTKHDPVGHDIFYAHLDKVPQSLINNSRRKSLIGGGSRSAAAAAATLPPPGLPATEPRPLNIWKTNWQPL